MRLNPFGAQSETRDRATRILEIISERCSKGAATRSLETVCGYNFIAEFDSWSEDFKHLLDRAR